MANYKKITDVAVLAEASEITNVLVEENGSLKKVPAASMGGGNGNFVFIDAVMQESTGGGTAMMLDESGSTFTYSASVTYDELLEMYNNMELSGIIMRGFFNGQYPVQSFILVSQCVHEIDNNMFMFMYFFGGSTEPSYLYFLSDGTITETDPAGGGTAT